MRGGLRPGGDEGIDNCSGDRLHGPGGRCNAVEGLLLLAFSRSSARLAELLVQLGLTSYSKLPPFAPHSPPLLLHTLHSCLPESGLPAWRQAGRQVRLAPNARLFRVLAHWCPHALHPLSLLRTRARALGVDQGASG
jgi:hypothetical protein